MNHHDPLLHPEDVPDAPRPPRPVWRYSLYALAVVLLVAAVAVTATRTDWSGLKQAKSADVAGLALFIVAGIGTSAVMFQLATRPFEHPQKPVSLHDWAALLAGAALLNYLPMRAGLIGRVAYLKQQHAIGFRASAASLAAIGGGMVFVYLLLCAVTLWRGTFDAVWFGSVTLGVAAGSLIGWPIFRVLISRWGNPAHALPAGLPLWMFAWGILRVLDTFFWAGRLWLAAKIFGHPIALEPALVLATASSFIELATPLPGGLGLREWVGGLIISSGLIAAGSFDLAQGMSVMVVDRAVQIVVVTATGGASLLYLHRKSAAA